MGCRTWGEAGCQVDHFREEEGSEQSVCNVWGTYQENSFEYQMPSAEHNLSTVSGLTAHHRWESKQLQGAGKGGAVGEQAGNDV